jgi:hypothetical protein
MKSRDINSCLYPPFNLSSLAFSCVLLIHHSSSLSVLQSSTRLFTLAVCRLLLGRLSFLSSLFTFYFEVTKLGYNTLELI